MTGNDQIASTLVRVGGRLHVRYSHGHGYDLGGPSDGTMEVTAVNDAGAGVTITFADGDHWGELVVDAAEPVWVRRDAR